MSCYVYFVPLMEFHRTRYAIFLLNGFYYVQGPDHSLGTRHWSLTEKASVQYRATLSGVCGGRSGTTTGFYQSS
jgi:hypothetical protein